jgi:hypothetical protein
MGIHTAEPLISGPSPLEAKPAIENLKEYKLPDCDQIPAELIQAEGLTLLSETHKLFYME